MSKIDYLLCSQRGSVFQYSEILLSEFFFLNEPGYVLILIFLPPVVHDIQIESP